ncbi:MAG: acetylxylan esterase [Pirellulaceae bacterium]|nr:acetylxylan esterase [Planctomycetales bacterium]
MKREYCALLAFATLAVSLAIATVRADDQSQSGTRRGDDLLSDYLSRQSATIAAADLSDIDSLEAWTNRRAELRRQLFDMLGLEPLPERTPLHPVVTGMIEKEDFRVEKLHFQSRPGLYVTGNLYLPKVATEPAPTVLYVCGHAPAKQDGVSLGNKTSYQHHGAWFARHGYVCLVIDTMQLGEIEGLHHGTYREGMMWWISRGYTPAGVEAWNCVRALDYLETRPEVDKARLGVTGRSGGGAYSWWLAALDDRVQVAVPVAGITSLKNHVVDGCIEGHCDCMYMVNTYRWDFPTVAALVAPRPLLISNTDKDDIFPLDGVYDVYVKTRRIYQLYGAADKLGLHICEGPHKDTQQLRVHAFQWMNRWLKGDEPLISIPAEKLLEPTELRVFDSLPTDQINSLVHETFVPPFADDPPESRSLATRDALAQRLRHHVFGGWPGDESEQEPLDVQLVADATAESFRLRVFEFTSQAPYRLPLYVVDRVPVKATGDVHADAASCVVECLDQVTWERRMAALQQKFPGIPAANLDADRGATESGNGIAATNDELNAFLASVEAPPEELATWIGIAPRGIGPTEWTVDQRARVHIERRHVLLGQTIAGMRVWDVCRAIEAIRAESNISASQVQLRGEDESAVWCLLAALYTDVEELQLVQLPPTYREAPPLLNFARFATLKTVAQALRSRTRVMMRHRSDSPPR